MGIQKVKLISLDEFKQLMTLDEIMGEDRPVMDEVLGESRALKMADLMTLSKEAPDQKTLAKSLTANPNIDFEFIELSSEHEIYW